MNVIKKCVKCLDVFASDRDKCRKMTGEHKKDFSSFHDKNDNNIHYCGEHRINFATSHNAQLFIFTSANEVAGR